MGPPFVNATMPDLRALLLTDIVESTRLAQTLGDATMAGHWAAHDRAARDLLPVWRGREIDKTDGLLLLFDTAADAAGYALAYHRALRELGLPLMARAGLHVGAVTLRENTPADVALGAKPLEVEGLAKPVAARVMAAALGGQTLLTADARLALGVASQRVQSHGHWRLSGVNEPIELFEIGNADAPFVPPPDQAKAYRVVRQGELWQPVREVRHSLPAERDDFVGRSARLAALAQVIEGGARLVSVLGIGGTGKTRFVTRFAWTWLGEFPGGVWFCDLSLARSADDICGAVAQGLDVPLGRGDPLVQLGNAIAGHGDCLVILDNFEQVVPFAEATLGRWLDRAARARFLVTTRERLGVVGEQTFALEPLPEADAAALFLRRAQAVRSDWVPGPADVAAVGQLVKVLDGLPLAIELAAARVRTMSPSALLARMHERFNVLLSRAGRRDRQATLRAAFDWSWELLSEPEKAALAQLSVFRGGFTAESVAAVVEVDGAGSPVDTVHWLVDKSFVRASADDRFDLLESVREYAAEHLATAGRFAGSGAVAQAAAEQRHGVFFASIDAKRAVAQACVELDNLVIALRRATARGDADTTARTLNGAWACINLRGPFRLGLELAEKARGLSGLSGANEADIELVNGFALPLAGRPAEAVGHLERALTSARAHADPTTEARALQSLGALHAQAGDLGAAADAFASARAALPGTNDASVKCSVLNACGAFSESTGHADEARAHYESALAIARAAGERRWEGGSAGNLAQFFANQGHAAEARKLYAQAVQIACELGDRHWEANTRCNLGLLHFSEGHLGDAQTELGAALTAAREMGYVRLLSTVQCNLALVAEAQGDPVAALALHEAALAIARELGDRRSEGQCLTYLGVLHARQSRFAAAREALGAGEALLRAVTDHTSLGILLCHRAEAEARAGDAAAAERWFAEATALAAAAPVLAESEFGQALRRAQAQLGLAA